MFKKNATNYAARFLVFMLFFGLNRALSRAAKHTAIVFY